MAGVSELESSTLDFAIWPPSLPLRRLTTFSSLELSSVHRLLFSGTTNTTSTYRPLANREYFVTRQTLDAGTVARD